LGFDEMQAIISYYDDNTAYPALMMVSNNYNNRRK